ncbi:23S rRNA (guanosine(2251)-2'-O)-methyltransferase RlmB [Balneola sp. EhC07]|uniref:23S rRNA (guanosine(2251)-2'-O)-methyltransferase RlmB n=1 Tax=Balneola sp. EhC07 TaxID=1849360 RepID=UPI0007F44EE5|nr:23S rRNA (guanosine(2251)-2'-O)-methyltransferase RlmB [Balneola sp. EhC07]OAN59704.1 23S rRNA (guanosine(2251)-2'-O)-methyltransferase RlmB [Balneola sp. EhC07]
MSKTDNIYIYGRNPIIEALINRPNEVEKVFIKNSIQLNSIDGLADLISKNSIPVSKVPQIKIQNLVGRVNDQGIVALLSQISYTNFFDWVSELDLKSNPAVVLLDGIEDPYNFGAILRSAVAAGISAVLVPTQKQAPVNATVFKTSSGTAGRIPIIRVHDINQGIKDLELAGFKIFGLDGDSKRSFWEAEFNTPTAFLIGNEGEGIDRKTLKKTSETLRIPMVNNVESLNASVSAALICYEWARKRI